MFKYLPAWLSVYYLWPGVYRDQRKMSESLKLNLQTAMSHHVGAGNRTRASERAASATGPSLQPYFPITGEEVYSCYSLPVAVKKKLHVPFLIYPHTGLEWRGEGRATAQLAQKKSRGEKEAGPPKQTTLTLYYSLHWIVLISWLSALPCLQVFRWSTWTDAFLSVTCFSGFVYYCNIFIVREYAHKKANSIVHAVTTLRFKNKIIPWEVTPSGHENNTNSQRTHTYTCMNVHTHR